MWEKKFYLTRVVGFSAKRRYGQGCSKALKIDFKEQMEKRVNMDKTGEGVPEKGVAVVKGSQTGRLKVVIERRPISMWCVW